MSTGRELAKPALTVTALSRPWWDAVSEGMLLLQRCVACGHLQHYPRLLCASCWGLDLEWTEAVGPGIVRAFTVVRRPGHPAWIADAPYVIGLVQLDEGPTMMTRIVDIEPENVRVGQRVLLDTRVLSDGESALPVFRSEVE